MTAITSSRGNTEVVSARRTESHDIPGIINLISNSTKKAFGRINVTYLLEKSNLAVTLSNEKKEAIAHALFLDYPNWSITDQSDWESFLNENYINNKCTPLNTLFLHLFVSREEYTAGCSQEIVRTIFNIVPELQFLLLFIPADENLDPALGSIFEEMTTMPGSTVDPNFTLLVCHRHQYYPQLYVRKARLEDHDDLMPILTRHSETLKEIYGEYFLADLLETQDEENQAVVGEDGGTAVGFMSLCSQVNISLLHECFDLGPFHGLCKPHPDDILKMAQEPNFQEGSQEAESVSSQNFECISDQDAAIQVILLHTAMLILNTVSHTELPLDDVRGKDFKFSVTPVFETEEKDAFRPVHRGTPNAFCIRLFCIDKKHETRSLTACILCICFQDKDFCIIVVPHFAPEFHLIQSFVRVVPFCTSTFNHELYIFHRAGLLKSFNIRRATTNDILGVEMLIKTLSLNESILNDLKMFTLARKDPVNFQILIFQDIEYIHSHYNIEDFIHFYHHQREEHGHLYHFVLNPIFHHYTKHFLKEILRLAHKSSLYYPIYPQYAEGKFQNPCAHSLTSALHYMVPVRPRRQIVYPLEELGINAPSEQVSKDQLGYALNYINRKLTLESKVSINTRIVVVGASDVGISFLETLVFCPHLKFNNLTLISIHGLPGKNLPGSKHGRFLINSHCFNDQDYAQMSLCSWVNIVVGKMTGINRAAKHVVVSKGKKVPYDHLVLCTGQQYQVPCPTGADISKLPTNREVTRKCQQRYTGKVPSNLFILCDDQDCLKAMHWLQENIVNSEGNVIVYGNTIDIYTTVETLLSLGINGSRIHLVQPPLSSYVTCLNNSAIKSAVEEALAKAGVSVYYDSVLAEWSESDHLGCITWASFMTNTKPFKLHCSAFFSFASRTVDYETFKAINDACLVYDGRLVIDTNFQTNDVSIRAAGPLTKFSNRYFANEWTHSDFSSKETGFQLAVSMLNLLDPTLEPCSEPQKDMDRLIPMYKGCKIKGGVLPGGYNYLHVSKPEFPMCLDIQLAQPNYGTEIITGEARHGNYFRIYVNEYSMVEAITCFSKEPLPVSNYICLYGQHERLLNDLCSRWKEMLITDLYSYFREPWSMAIYHDRFIDLKNELRQILMTSEVGSSAGLVQLLHGPGDGDDTDETPQQLLERHLAAVSFEQRAASRVLAYLRGHGRHLPMYAQPAGGR
uniref:Cilia and flagella associated protein 61 n=1 Tax=Dromaius novaehollandiae TaxID=8790 RepID=A0A8C4JX22_DRONO